MPILFWYISQVIVQYKFDIFTSKIRRKKQCGNPLTLLFTFLHQNLFDIKKHLALALKKIAHVLFCVFQANLNKAVSHFLYTISMDQKYTK